jgi:hypothetical protein
MPNNQYDSFGFRMYADSSLNVKPNAVEKLICLGNKKTLAQKAIRNKVTR